MPTDPQEALVEALTHLLDEACQAGSHSGYAAPMETHRYHATRFIATHRLVVMPEEPERWEAEIVDLYNGGVTRWIGTSRKKQAHEWATMPDSHKERSTGRIVEIRFHRSPPINVKEESP